MNILGSIAAAEAAQKVHNKLSNQIVKERMEFESTLQCERREFESELRGKIVLDTDADPDPWGYHSISLVDRLKAMGWP